MVVGASQGVRGADNEGGECSQGLFHKQVKLRAPDEACSGEDAKQNSIIDS